MQQRADDDCRSKYQRPPLVDAPIRRYSRSHDRGKRDRKVVLAPTIELLMSKEEEEVVQSKMGEENWPSQNNNL